MRPFHNGHRATRDRCLVCAPSRDNWMLFHQNQTTTRLAGDGRSQREAMTLMARGHLFGVGSTANLIIAQGRERALSLLLSLNLRSRAFMTSLLASPIPINTVSTATSTATSPNASPNTRPLAGVTTSSVSPPGPPAEKKRHASFKKKTKKTCLLYTSPSPRD